MQKQNNNMYLMKKLQHISSFFVLSDISDDKIGKLFYL